MDLCRPLRRLRSGPPRNLRRGQEVRPSHHRPRAAVGDAINARWPSDRPRSGRAPVVVVEPADLRDRHHPPEPWRLHLAWPWTVVFGRLMRTYRVVVGEVDAQQSAEMGLAQNDEMIQALVPNGADEPLDKGVLPRRSGGRNHVPDPHGVDAPGERLA